ncbi:2-oxoglutarate/malate translocase OMT [Toxoplasma gondii TgCatPRC2]|uniref:2-oxoglutarate/malate translocase OMT n=6 Tax=Toxoplasma gondii TaxID=5811 RepID=B6KDT4_TOXGV|nr:2-oxoglutarate/malate translocase OMT [Toxoplasma gondii ME49]ESS36057.1 2-oxoglutarate/malate translocase OMT [Toxoplasma gondii VEG]KFH11494.1 2-oxoglutarate/malate translocase OMT [Toxoplasma gondii VAND]KYF46372.1 2-oxoglutarate/malate translocase OMT [Toxoplasma gondii ARI]KYK71432.1 2-oxoglutarate/malate translocase OMT [Toxoplasma gondii TgCatPRC2]PIM04223.1 2-oxoglutarate/malate translocase OMT [Toxoplasma gondii COUG]|eukprot:XP_002366007.1 2-oxoglutarate/malate translocase OMT [Toxoplasma gondii ME49]
MAASSSAVSGASSSPGSVKKADTFIKRVQPFAVGGLSGCVATTCVQPIDMIKVRIQLAGEAGGSTNPFTVCRNIAKNEGISGLYKGLDAGLIRQLTYSTARLGLFRIISDEMRQMEPKDENGVARPLPLWKKAVAGLAAGGLGSFFGNPADLALIRLQADATLPPDQRRNYTGVLNAISRIVKEEGLFGLWRGSTPTVLRAMALNMGMLASNDQAKELLEPAFGKGWTTTLGASAISGFFAVTFSLPFDFIKTRMQKMRRDPVTGQLPYKNFCDAVVKITRREGIMSLYTGYPTYYVRIAPHAMITLISMEYLNKMWNRYTSV